jgi:1,4-dihydroxy-2-naphthoate octaprenyltransferase
MRKIIALIENLSLHVVAGSLCSALFASAVLHVNLPLWWLFSLGLAVWSVYTLDHLFDAKLNSGRLKNLRHQFHERHFNTLVFLLLLTSLTGLIVFSRFATLQMWLAAGLLAVFAVIHIVSVNAASLSNKIWLQKEVQIALIYSIGIWLGPLQLNQKTIDIQVLMVFVSFTLLVWWETSFIAFDERETDLKQQNTTLATRLGTQKTRKLLLSTLVLQLVFTSVLLLLSDGTAAKAFLVLFMMGLVFAFLFIYRNNFSNSRLLHFTGEMVFCLPFVFYLI